MAVIFLSHFVFIDTRTPYILKITFFILCILSIVYVSCVINYEYFYVFLFAKRFIRLGQAFDGLWTMGQCCSSWTRVYSQERDSVCNLNVYFSMLLTSHNISLPIFIILSKFFVYLVYHNILSISHKYLLTIFIFKFFTSISRNFFPSQKPHIWKTHVYQYHTFLRHTIHHQDIVCVCDRPNICSTYIGPLMCKKISYQYVSNHLCKALFQHALKFLLNQKSHIFICKIFCHTSDTISQPISNRFSNFFQKIVLHT